MCIEWELNFQMVGLTRSTPNGFGALGSDDLSPQPPTTLTEAFVAAQTEVLCQILQAQPDAPASTTDASDATEALTLRALLIQSTYPD
jgi:hypothetical protein